MQVADKRGEHPWFAFHKAVVGRRSGEVAPKAAVQDFKALVAAEVIKHFDAHHFTDGKAEYIDCADAAGSGQQVRLEGLFKGDTKIIHLAKHLD